MIAAFRLQAKAMELTRKANREVADIDHLLHLAQAFGQSLAHLDRH